MTKNNLNLQPVSFDTWYDKYALKDRHGTPIDTSIDDTIDRVALALARVETSDTRHWHRLFKETIYRGATPAGRIMANAGAADHKPGSSLINCVLSDTIEDTLPSIMEHLSRGATSLKADCGIGYEFSTLRPRGATVHGAGSTSSGPVSYMDTYSSMAGTISSAGGRRGAQMATFDVGHPDIEEFITAKRTPGRLRHFNLSVLITNEFLEYVEQDKDWPLAFPVTENQCERESIDLKGDDIIYRFWPENDEYITDSQGKTACKVHRTVPAREIWDKIVRSNYEFDEPGYILIDRVNQFNNLWFCEDIRASNPCGEQFLQPNGACLLGSIILSKLVTRPFTRRADFDFEALKEITTVFSRMLDNVVDIANLPLPEQTNELLSKRRHGMGFLALDSTYCMMGMDYGSSAALELEEEILKTMFLAGLEAGISLAEEKGPAPVMTETFELTPLKLNRHPNENTRALISKGPRSGAFLWANSPYHEILRDLIPDDLFNKMEQSGSRYSHQLSIAPTGTLALSFGNNCSSGIEPTFADNQIRNIIVSGRKTKQMNVLESATIPDYMELLDKSDNPEELVHSPHRIPADEVSVDAHINTQAIAQKYMDSAVSKTLTAPSTIDMDEFKDIYRKAAGLGLKGCTVYRRDKDTSIGYVITTPESLEKAEITFTLEDGSTMTCKGSDTIEYDGDTHNAQNLAEAIKEGYYGRL